MVLAKKVQHSQIGDGHESFSELVCIEHIPKAPGIPEPRFLAQPFNGISAPVSTQRFYFIPIVGTSSSATQSKRIRPSRYIPNLKTNHHNWRCSLESRGCRALNRISSRSHFFCSMRGDVCLALVPGNRSTTDRPPCRHRREWPGEIP